MATVQELVAIGKELGLEGPELHRFIKDEQDRARDEREREREDRREEQEKNRQHVLKLEEMRRETALSLDKIEREKEEREEARMLREHKMKMEVMQAETEKNQGQPEPSSHINASLDQVVKGPKIPPFEDSTDNIDAYLERFERYAVARKWPKEQWGANLSALLKGKALDVFSRLPVEEALNFEELKGALLRRFEKTEEGFRKSFRSARPEQGETFSQFAVRLDSYLEKWVVMTHTEKTYNRLKDLMVRDQLLHCCGRDLALFLKERIPDTVAKMAKLADQFAEARGVRSNQLLTKIHKPDQNNSPGNKKTGYEKPSPSTFAQGPKGGTTHAKDKKCYACGKMGHVSYECKSKSNAMSAVSEAEGDANEKKSESGKVAVKSGSRGRNSCRGRGRGSANKVAEGSVFTGDPDTPSLSESCHVKLNCLSNMPVVYGYVGDHSVQVLRDGGCSGIVVRKSLITDDQLTGEKKICSLADGSKIQAAVANIDIDSPYFTGKVDAWVLDTPLYDLIIGNVEGAAPPEQPDSNWSRKQLSVQAVQTRGQKKREEETYQPMKVSKVIEKIGNLEELKSLQQQDETLIRLRSLAEKKDVLERDDGGKSEFCYSKGVLYRKFKSPAVQNGKEFKQLVVPQKYRETVLKLAHDSIMSGHFGGKRTTSRVLSEFFWPGVQSDVTRFCRSCDICQRTFPKGRVAKAPLGTMPIIDTPFKRIAVDLVGPLQPCTDRGNRYILTIVDYATRYPEAVALKGIEAERVAEALVDVFSRVGVPTEMLTDMGSQFTSEVMAEVSRLLSIRRLTTTPYHPMCNGLVERFNGTLKQMLRRMCSERPRDWDKFLNSLLFAYREVPQDSMGFSPFELLYGRTVRGPMMILKELWTKEVSDEDVKTTYQYVMDLRERLEETCKMATENLKCAKSKQMKYYNRKAKDRQLNVGDKVLILLPTKANKLLMQWRGPYKILDKMGPMDYSVDVAGKKKTFHVNLLRKYIEREGGEQTGCVAGILSCISTVVVNEEEMDMDCHRELEPLPSQGGKENIRDVVLFESMMLEQTTEVFDLLSDFKDVLTDLPGRTNLAKHDIQTSTRDPVRVKQYPLPFHTKEAIQKEVDLMLDMGVIEPSTSPYSAPVIIVKKKDGSNRFCIDFRCLNKITIFDAEPMPNTEEIFAKLSGCNFFSKLDLSKGYWQVPMAENAMEMTAFTTPQGLFHFRVMPFGLVNAPATFSRLMRKLLFKMENVDNFIDDIIVFTKSWDEHLAVLRELFQRLRKAGLTARPTKCSIGFQSLPCLGHIISGKRLEPEPQKLKAIQDAPRPETKKQVRSFLGLAGFYRKFIPNFSVVALPLIELTKKGCRNTVVWGDSQEKAFQTLKKLLTAEPILKLPDMMTEFILRTDASDTGIGAVLLQTEGDTKLPVAYASRKLQQREKNYAVVEKECLAIIWAIQKFETYIYGKEFILETDHHPLVYLNRSKTANGRLMRWALLLQQYRFRIQAIRGSDNIGADYLSRA